ncbi:MAG: 4-hydroxy-tetrahydrodipicolinate synthase [Pseudomonadota bacterium]
MFKGSIPALVTPFTNGAINHTQYLSLIERQIKAGSAALVPCGTTGESATLSHAEHEEALELCVEAAAGRVPVIAGCGSNATAEAISLVRHAKTVGADAAMLICPYYNRPDQAGLEAHFRAVADAVEMPLFIYNVPSRTACDILPETLGRLAAHPNIIGVKDATGDMSRATRHRALCGEGFIQLSGDDPSALGHRAMGGAGCISVTANVAPAACAALHAAVDQGDFTEAREIEARISDLHHALFSSASPGPTKYALHKLGLCDPEVRLPIVWPDEAAQRVIDAAMAKAGVEA